MERFLSRMTMSLATALAATLFVAAAIGFLGVAVYLLLVPLMPAPLAALLVGVIGLSIAGLIVLVARFARHRGAAVRPIAVASPARAADLNDMAAALGDLAAQKLTYRAQAHPYYAFAIALLVGLAAGASPTLRDIITGAARH